MNHITFTNSKSASENAPFYDEQWASFAPEPLGEQETSRIKAICEAIKEFSDCNKTLRILDLGCGRGWMAPFLSRYGKVHGVDFSEIGIQFAQQHFSKFGTFSLADPQETNLGLGDVIFDVVVSSEVIEHVPHQIDYVHSILRLLAAKGLCILTTPNGNLWEKYKTDPRFTHHLQPVENWLTPDKLRALVADSNLRCLRHEGIAIHKIRLGNLQWLQHKRVRNWIEKFKLQRVYGKLILQHALYQIVVARK